jgi:lipoprotein-anchoring transpeptidase ErfK/SrfK
VVVVKHRRLYFVTKRGRAIRYVVGVGREGMSWKGTARIARKAEWPSWTPPADMRVRARKKGVFLP